ncbi:hypothetical protein FZ025_08955 [Xanthomonas hyacinthi]|uniref:Uncharacterized protein n=2 Tax=Xanthomonas hyacinthi TaxID=56455 RepID=A0A2S7EYE4_9XANT|nr:hypothetical protein Y886_27190 [Xanthomonas hyacinthi DSM 19077]PPU98176.1 hypothetical protein XhyaCFBP1156_08185 [Xanthomonas hyacinthi]QGY76776.1 hypothetical protein FZ025_08955 [Xanthomonas hyacinthi]
MCNAVRSVVAAALLGMAAHAHARQADPAPVATSPPPQDVQTLGEVRALPPDAEQPLDLYRFKNPVSAQPNRFDKDWRPPPSVEQVSQGGGYLALGIYYVAGKAAKGLHALTGAPDHVQPAIARPPPLDDAQLRRAAQLCDAQNADCAAQQ